MRFVELSEESLRRESRKLAESVGKEFSPDAVAYLAKGGFLVGVEVSRYFDVPLIELSSRRSGDGAKELARGTLRILPRFLKHALREVEVHLRLARRSEGRASKQGKTMRITERYELPLSAGSILIVDDSVDTGTSMRVAKSVLGALYPGAHIEIAAINVFSASAKTVEVGYGNFTDCLLSTPASKDNKDYQRFLRLYLQGGLGEAGEA